MTGPSKRPGAATLLVAFLALFVVFTVAGFARNWRGPAATTEGDGIDGVIDYLLVATGIICVVGHVVLCWFIWKGSAARPAAPDGYRAPSRRVEWFWSLLPVLLMSVVAEAGVLVAGTPVWRDLFIDKPANPVELEVVGKQFEWFVRYPGLRDGKLGRFHLADVDSQDNPLGLEEDDEAAQDDIVKRGTIYLPVGRPAVIRLRTHDVIHSFFVPAFRVKQDLIPGFGTRIKFTPTRTGVYELACAELCGLGHYKMRGEVHVVEPAEYEAWLARQFTFGG